MKNRDKTLLLNEYKIMNITVIFQKKKIKILKCHYILYFMK